MYVSNVVESSVLNGAAELSTSKIQSQGARDRLTLLHSKPLMLSN
jgi:hypothetical protein